MVADDPKQHTQKIKGVVQGLVTHLIAVPRHTETECRRYHHQMCVLDIASYSESVASHNFVHSNQMIPAIRKDVGKVADPRTEAS